MNHLSSDANAWREQLFGTLRRFNGSGSCTVYVAAAAGCCVQVGLCASFGRTMVIYTCRRRYLFHNIICRVMASKGHLSANVFLCIRHLGAAVSWNAGSAI